MMRKVTALLTLFGFCAGLLAPGFLVSETYAQTTENEKKIDTAYVESYDEYMGLLYALGIMEEITDMSGEVSRGEFAYYIAKIVFSDDVLAGITPGFDDCGALTAAEQGAIGYLRLLGVVGGYSNTEFVPDDKISLDEAVKMIVSFIGLDDAAMDKGGFPAGYRVVANQRDLLAAITQEEGKPLTYLSAAKLIFHTLECEVSESGSFFGSGRYYGTDVFRELWIKLYATEGIVSDNGTISLYGASEIPEDGIKVGSTLIRNYTGDDLLGKRIKVYYRYDKNSGKNMFVYALGHDALNRYESFWATDDLKYSNHAYEYYYDDYASKPEKAALEKNFILIYNGKTVSDGILFDEAYMLPQSGYIKLIDNDLNNRYDIVSIVEYTKTFVVEIADSEKNVIYDKDGNTLDLNETSVDYTFTDDTGMQLSAADCMMAGTVLSVGESICKKGRIIVKRTVTVSGTVQEISSSGKIFINDGMYSISPSYQSTLVLGESGTFYLDERNEIIWFIPDTNKELLGYIMDAKSSGGFGSAPPQIKILVEDGIVRIYDAKNKVEVDGGNLNASELVQKFEGNPQLVRFKLDEMSRIYWIDTTDADQEFTNSTLSVIEGVENVELNYYKNAEVLQGKAIVDSVTKVFLIPNDPSDETQFVVADEDYFESSEMKCRNVTAYKTGDTPYAVALVLKLDITGRDVRTDVSCREPYVVTDVCRTLNEEGDIVTEVVLKDMKGNANTVKTEKADDLAFETEDGSKSEVEIGDVIRYGYNSKGYITKDNFLVVYDADKKKFYEGNTYNYAATRYYADHLTQPVYAISSYEDFIRFSFKNPETNSLTAADKYIYPTSKFTFYKYDSEAKEVKEAAATDIIPYDISITEYSYGMIYLNYFNGGFCIVYR